MRTSSFSSGATSTRWAALALALVCWGLTPAARAQSGAPFGISQMQFGPQASWSHQYEEKTLYADQYHNSHDNYGLGLNGRIQFSLVDLIMDGGKRTAGAFRIVDVLAAEAGFGYVQDNIDSHSAAIEFQAADKTLWYNFGVDLGLAALVRVVPTVDVGVKCRLSAFANSTFMATGYTVYDHPVNINGGFLGTTYTYEKGSRDLKFYGGYYVWSGLLRVGRFYGEFSPMRGYGREGEQNAEPTYVNVFDLKYQYADRAGATWAPYVGLQVGTGTTTRGPNYGGGGEASTFSRNWVQVSIGKMVNY